MLYLMRCDTCKKELTIGCPVEQWDDIIKPGMPHDDCYGMLAQVITAPRAVFGREPFPRTGAEVQLPTPDHVDIKFDDKIHAREYLAENGLTSKWIENDM